MGGHNDVAFETGNTDLSLCHLAVCLVSGGMDSCVTSAIARQENDELAFLHVSYGQSTAARERRAFERLADLLSRMQIFRSRKPIYLRKKSPPATFLFGMRIYFQSPPAGQRRSTLDEFISALWLKILPAIPTVVRIFTR